VARIRGEMQSIMEKVGFKERCRNFHEAADGSAVLLQDAGGMLEAYRALAKRIDPNSSKFSRHYPAPP